MSNNHTKIAFKVIPNAGKDEIVGFAQGIWRVKIVAPPDKGKANKELIEFLSKTLRIKKGQVTILKGLTSHNKIVAVEGLTSGEAEAGLLAKIHIKNEGA